ncbi:Hsp20/alpha crystallin family protein [Myxococcaceae bacterium GXIMD 01537]
MADLPVRRGSGAVRREWDPFQRMQEVMGWDPLETMSQLLSAREGAAGTFVPAFDVKETKDAFIFKADLPGIEEKDLDITLTGDRLVVSGKRESEKREQHERYFTWERSAGSFSRAFTLPEGINGEAVNAELKGGVLTLVLPKKPEVQPKRIKVGGEKLDRPKA